MQTEICSLNALPERVSNSMFLDRRKQFVDRMRWDLNVTSNGGEMDEYDDGNSVYLVVHDKSQHLCSCRVRPIQCATMIVDHFRSSFPNAQEFIAMQNNCVCELTRFCRTPSLSPHQSKLALAQMCSLMDRYRWENRITAYVAVVFPKVARFMDRIGMRYLVLSKSLVNGEMAQFICITESSRMVEKAVIELGGLADLRDKPRLVA